MAQGFAGNRPLLDQELWDFSQALRGQSFYTPDDPVNTRVQSYIGQYSGGDISPQEIEARVRAIYRDAGQSSGLQESPNPTPTYFNTGGDRVSAGNIASQYDPLFSDINRQQASAKSRQASQKSFVGQQFGAQKSEAERQKGVSQEKIGREKGFALKDLEGNIRSAFQAGQIRLGGMGAGDSSAAQVNYPFALTRLSNQNRGMIQRTALEQTGDIEESFNQGMAQLQMWRDTQINSISERFQDIMSQLESQKANVSFQRARDIGNLQAQLYDSAVAATQQVNQQAAQMTQQMQAAPAPQLQVTGNPQVQGQQLRPMGSFNPQVTMGGRQTQGSPQLFPAVRSSRRDELGLQG